MRSFVFDVADLLCRKLVVENHHTDFTLRILFVYDELSDEDKEAYEETFEDEHGDLPESIGASALNTWIFNEDTIKKVLNILMTEGIKIEYGQKIGKTIIFARNHDHAEKILGNCFITQIIVSIVYLVFRYTYIMLCSKGKHQRLVCPT